MQFFDRDKEISLLRRVRELSARSAQFTVITGRWRIGKTSLVLKAYGESTVLYFFVARKTEAELCQDFTQELEENGLIGLKDVFAVCGKNHSDDE